MRRGLFDDDKAKAFIQPPGRVPFQHPKRDRQACTKALIQHSPDQVCSDSLALNPREDIDLFQEELGVSFLGGNHANVLAVQNNDLILARLEMLPEVVELPPFT